MRTRTVHPWGIDLCGRSANSCSRSLCFRDWKSHTCSKAARGVCEDGTRTPSPNRENFCASAALGHFCATKNMKNKEKCNLPGRPKVQKVGEAVQSGQSVRTKVNKTWIKHCTTTRTMCCVMELRDPRDCYSLLTGRELTASQLSTARSSPFFHTICSSQIDSCHREKFLLLQREEGMSAVGKETEGILWRILCFQN